MTYLRFLTLRSACRVHDDVRLVIRREPVNAGEAWIERQDFHYSGGNGRNWFFELEALPVRIMGLEEISPQLEDLRASDVQTKDLLNWFLLATRGGTVADMDILFVQDLPPILTDVEAVAYDGPPNPGKISVAFMQGWPDPRWEQAFDRALEAYDPNIYESCGHGIFDREDLDRALDPRLLFPWYGTGAKWRDWHRWLFEADEWPELPDRLVGLHWYGGRNQAWNQRIEGPESLPRGAVGAIMRQLVRGADHCASLS